MQYLSVALVVALVAGTLRSIRGNLMRRPAKSARSVMLGISNVWEMLLWLGCVLCVAVAMPHPVTIVILAMLLAAVLTGLRLRYLEEVRSLNHWVRTGIESGTSIPILVDQLADGCRTKLARRARVFAFRINRGESIVDATWRSKLPLDASTLALVAMPNHSVRADLLDEGNLERLGDLAASADVDVSNVRQQFLYVVVTMLLACLLGLFIRWFVLATLDKIADENGVEFSSTRWLLDAAETFGNVVVSVIVMMGLWLLAMETPWMPRWLIRIVPWFGRRAIDLGRRDVLATVERGVRLGQSETEILRLSQATTRKRWIRSCCRRALAIVDGGTSLPVALRAANLVSKREQIWLSTAETNGHLADALNQLIGNIARRQALSWRLRMAWFVPLGTVVVGAYVLVHAGYVFHVLYSFVIREA